MDQTDMQNTATPETGSQDAQPRTDKPQPRSGWIEEIEVSGDRLVAEIKRLAAETQVRRVRILEPDGDVAVDIPLTVGAIAGGAVVLAAPVLAILGALAAFVTKVKIEVIRAPQDAAPDTAA